MLILSVESSCDETAVALVRDGREVLTDQHLLAGGAAPALRRRRARDRLAQAHRSDLRPCRAGACRRECAPHRHRRRRRDLCARPDRRAARRREFRQGRSAGAGRAADPRASYPRPYRRQLHCLSRAEAAVSLPRRLRRAHDDRRRPRLYRSEHSRHHARRRGGRVLRQGRARCSACPIRAERRSTAWQSGGDERKISHAAHQGQRQSLGYVVLRIKNGGGQSDP